MQTNNYLPAIVQKGARKAVKYVCSGPRSMKYYKDVAHKAYRRKMNQQIHLIEKGDKDQEELDLYPDKTSMVTAWDIW